MTKNKYHISGIDRCRISLFSYLSPRIKEKT